MLPELYVGRGAGEAAWIRARSLLAGEPLAHPDVWAAEVQGGTIGIDRIRSLILWARYAPIQGRWRVAVLGPAESLSPEAANALLKILEDVPPYLALLLYAEAADRLLPTVRSRCTAIPAPSPREVWARALEEQGYSPEEISFLLSLCWEREEELVAFLQDKRDPVSEWRQAKAEAEGLPFSELGSRFPGEAADPLRRRAWAQVLIPQIPTAPVADLLTLAEKLGKTKTLPQFLWELLVFLREGEADLPREVRVSWAKKVSLARAELEANANPRLLGEVILLWPRRG